MINFFDDVPMFVAVVEAGSFAAAGKRLNLSRSAVGKGIARIEHRLEARLFQRTTRRLSLTDEGQILYERCLRAMAELNAAKAMIEAGHTSATGKLRVSMPVLYGRLKIAPALLRLARAHPDLELDLDFSDHLVDVIGQNYDLCIRIAAPHDDAGLMVRRFDNEATVVCAAPTYLAEHGEPNDVEELIAHQKIAYTRAGRTQLWRFPAANGHTTDLIPSTRFHLDDLGAILDFALAGFGLAWLPDWLVDEHLLTGKLVRLLPQRPALTSNIDVVWPGTPYLPRRVRVAIDALIEIGTRARVADPVIGTQLTAATLAPRVVPATPRSRL